MPTDSFSALQLFVVSTQKCGMCKMAYERLQNLGYSPNLLYIDEPGAPGFDNRINSVPQIAIGIEGRLSRKTASIMDYGDRDEIDSAILTLTAQFDGA